MVKTIFTSFPFFRIIKNSMALEFIYDSQGNFHNLKLSEYLWYSKRLQKEMCHAKGKKHSFWLYSSRMLTSRIFFRTLYHLKFQTYRIQIVYSFLSILHLINTNLDGRFFAYVVQFAHLTRLVDADLIPSLYIRF